RSCLMSTRLNELELSALAYPNGRIAVLLARCPHIGEPEREELTRLIQTASPDELRNLRRMPLLRGKIDCRVNNEPARPASTMATLLWIGLVVGLGWVGLMLL